MIAVAHANFKASDLTKKGVKESQILKMWATPLGPVLPVALPMPDWT